MSEPKTFKKQITYCGTKPFVACDGKCNKAWGIPGRPSSRPEPFTDDIDDVMWYGDDELGEAPEDPGTYEGGHGKPLSNEEFPNKWCVRACERSTLCDFEEDIPKSLPDWSKRCYNLKARQEIMEKKKMEPSVEGEETDKKVVSIFSDLTRDLFLKQVEAFKNGHWTLDMPQKTGQYFCRPLTCSSGETVIGVYEMEGELKATYEWRGWWWSAPLPKLPVTPDSEGKD